MASVSCRLTHISDEEYALVLLKNLRTAQESYKSKISGTSYGTLEQLEAAKLIDSSLTLEDLGK